MQSEQIKTCREEISRLRKEQEKLQADMKQVIRYSHMEELTQELVDTFIRKIYVYKDKRVEIEWGFRTNVCDINLPLILSQLSINLP